jgi:PAS domain S-box-containing protein
MADIHGQCIYINEHWSTASGKRLRWAVGAGWFETIHPEDREGVQTNWSLLVNQGVPFQCEYRYLRADGVQTVVLATAKEIGDKSQNKVRFLLIEQDISELKRSDQIINDQRSKIVAASKLAALNEMSAGIAHEINNPLAIICGQAAILKNRILNPDVDLQWVIKKVTLIESTSERIAKIVRSMRAILRDADLDTFELQSVATIIEQTLSMCSERFKTSNIALTAESFQPDLTIFCRPAQISQLLLNLLSNAFDAVETLEEKWVRIEVLEREDSVYFSVIDSGLGIPIILQDKVFQPFFTTKPPGSGIGLGLTVSKSIVESHGGTLEIDNVSIHTRLKFGISKTQTNKKGT